MFIYNETARAVTHFDSLSLLLTVEHPPPTLYTQVCHKKPVHNPDVDTSPELSLWGLFTTFKCT